MPKRWPRTIEWKYALESGLLSAFIGFILFLVSDATLGLIFLGLGIFLLIVSWLNRSKA